MSIKQNGGVFGRNPTFNDVTIEGDLIINGEVFTGLDFQGSWNASTNSPSLASSTGTNGEFYIVSVAGTTNLDGITNWGIGDWALFNGTVWQRVEGGADGNFNALTANSLNVNGVATVDGLTSDGTILATSSGTINTILRGGDGNSKNLIFQKATGGAQQAKISAIADDLRFTTGTTTEAMRIDSSANVKVLDGNLVIGTSGKGIDFSATSGTGTSELLDDYEEGTWTPTIITTTGSGTILYDASTGGSYTKVGRLVTASFRVRTTSLALRTGTVSIGGLPFILGASAIYASCVFGYGSGLQVVSATTPSGIAAPSASTIDVYVWDAATGPTAMGYAEFSDNGDLIGTITYMTDL